MTREKRSARRIPLTVQVTYRVDEQERTGDYQVESINVSKDGILLRTDMPLAIGTAIELEFSLPGREEKIRTNGEVVWSRGVSQHGEPSFSGKGIHFTECEDRCRSLIAEFIDD
jgi:uncharacterized protein (TIGR02266 family)